MYRSFISAGIRSKSRWWGKRARFFVPLVEEGWLKRPCDEQGRRRYLEGLKTKILDFL